MSTFGKDGHMKHNGVDGLDGPRNPNSTGPNPSSTREGNLGKSYVFFAIFFFRFLLT